ncbi:MAG: type I glyceraldehyde-3-phosphate dehydrogenase [Myxococcota bacterium]|nr:type I glyceraldehyde-3-phosphate dehydrogenase [Myxococcota bacterium]
MAVQIGINGFGRIGRIVFRATLDKDIEVVGINDLTSAATLAHLLKYDSVHGQFPGTVEVDGDNLIVNGKTIPVLSERDPASLPWGKLGAQIVVESTGIFTAREKAAKHLEGGAERVIISAPSGDPDETFVLGVNSDAYDKDKHFVVSNASCTTNCLAPFAKVLNDEFGLDSGWMTTIHAYTSDQLIQDGPHSDLRRARAAGASMIPTSTGAAKAIALVLPELKGKLDGYAMRVPTTDVSIVDLSCKLKKNTTAEEINAAFKAAADGPLKGILQFSDEPLVSIDFVGNAHSSIVDGLSTKVMDGNFAKVLSWYDNETGYSTRVVDLALLMGNA